MQLFLKRYSSQPSAVNNIVKKFLILLPLSLVLILAKPAMSDEAEDLAKQAQNPVAELISVPFQNNIGFLWPQAAGGQGEQLETDSAGKGWNVLCSFYGPPEPSFDNTLGRGEIDRLSQHPGSLMG